MMNKKTVVLSLMTLAAFTQACGGDDAQKTPETVLPDACREGGMTLIKYTGAYDENGQPEFTETPCQYGCEPATEAGPAYCKTECTQDDKPVCGDGTKFDTDRRLTCKNGYWKPETCKYGCTEGSGGAECNPYRSDWCESDQAGTFKCEDNQLMTCGSDNTWREAQTCRICTDIDDKPLCISAQLSDDALDKNKNGMYDFWESDFILERKDDVYFDEANSKFDETKVTKCVSDGKCQGYHRVCVFNSDMCASKCESDAGCIDGYTCRKSGVCHKPGTADTTDENSNNIHDADEPEFDGEKLNGQPCSVQSDCHDYQICLSGKCASKCESDDGCIDGYRCLDSGICTAFVFSFYPSSDTLYLPTGQYNNCDFTIDWGDGSEIETHRSCPKTLAHKFTSGGTITISGRLSGFSFLEKNGDENISRCPAQLTVKSFGNIGLGQGAFYGCNGLTVDAVDTPSADRLTDMTQFFEQATLNSASPVNLGIADWDVSKVTVMESAFAGMSHLPDISNWDVSNVTIMKGMFKGVNKLSRNLSGWNVSKVTDMSHMFADVASFEIDISKWNVANVTDMSGMFAGTTQFNGDIGKWNVANVTNMSNMFADVVAFNQNISDWNVEKVTDMSGMFKNATGFNQDLSNWNVSSVVNMSSMFANAESFNKSIQKWNVANVTDMGSMFSGAKKFNGNLSGWNVSKVTNMSGMFMNAADFNQEISGWDVSSVTNMANMFNGSISFESDLSGWDVSSVTTMEYMFKDAEKFESVLSGWNVSNVTNMAGMFSGASQFNSDISNWNVSNVTNMAGMFQSATNFNQDISNWNVSNVTNMAGMFQSASSFDKSLKDWNTENVTNMSYMFAKASKFNQDISNWDVLKVNDFIRMFYNASKFDQNISDWQPSDTAAFAGFFVGSAVSKANWCKMIKNSVFAAVQKAIWGYSVPYTCGE